MAAVVGGTVASVSARRRRRRRRRRKRRPAAVAAAATTAAVTIYMPGYPSDPIDEDIVDADVPISHLPERKLRAGLRPRA
jgi:hypothetical protein